MISFMKAAAQQNDTAVDNRLSYVGYRFPPDVISYNLDSAAGPKRHILAG
ncbi:hypothetical protein OKW27_003091 [Paraburkholderia sp. 35.1]